MFGFLHPRFPVIELQRTALVYGWVHLGKQPQWQQVGSIPIATQNYQTALETVQKKLAVSGFFVLLEDDVCYTSTVCVPLTTHYTRQYLFDEYIHTHIPEDVAPESWDFKLTKAINSEYKEALVVVPVQHIWQPFMKACTALKLTVIATEPISLANQRHQDPHIGITRKPDLSGRDADVLNIPPVPSWFEWLPVKPGLLVGISVGWVFTVVCIAWLIVLLFG